MKRATFLNYNSQYVNDCRYDEDEVITDNDVQQHHSVHVVEVPLLENDEVLVVDHIEQHTDHERAQ